MPNAQYSVTLLADNVSKSIVQMTTDFGEFHWTQNQIPFCGFFALQRWLHFFVVDFYSIYLESIIEAISAAPPGVWTAAFVHLWNQLYILLEPAINFDSLSESEISISSTAYVSLSVDVSFVGAGLREHMDFHLKWTKIADSTFQSRKGG